MYWLWAVNLAGAALIVIRLYFVALGRRPKVINMQRTMLREVGDKLKELPTPDELIALWREVPPEPGVDGAQRVVLRLLRFLRTADEAGDGSVGRLDAACKRYVDICNTTLAVRIDDGLLNPKTFVRSCPKLHQELVRAIPLIEPLIWYKSLVRGRGRWGYRVLALQSVLESLRVSSPWPEIKGEMRDAVVGGVTIVHPRVSWLARLWRGVTYNFVSPTINVRVKLRQRKRAGELAQALRAAGFALPDPRAVPW
jgi:hypothetical protein